MRKPTLSDRITGAIVGGAVGDALGAPMECMHYKDIRDVFGGVRRFDDFTDEMLTHSKFTRSVADIGLVTDDTVLADVLLDCIIETEGNVTAYDFARAWETLDKPVPNPDGEEVVRLDRLHFIEQIPFYRNRLREIQKRDLGRGEANTTSAVMYIAPVGLLCAGDPLEAELMAVEVTAVNQHGRPRDVAGGYAAAVAACFQPGLAAEDIVKVAVKHTRDAKSVKELRAMIALAEDSKSCDEFIERYYEEILDNVIPFQDWEHEGTEYCNSWNCSEVLGPVLATFLITRGQDAESMILACAKIGRDADTICRVGAGLFGAYGGCEAIPKEWRDYVLARNAWLRLEEKARALTDIVRKRLRAKIDMNTKLLQVLDPD